MPPIHLLVPTQIYQAKPRGAHALQLRADLERACRSIAAEDRVGQRWCREHDYRGYTSYASLDDLPWRNPVFADLVTVLDVHVGRFGRSLQYDLGARRLKLDSMWINVLEPGGMHTGHIHPGSVISGTYYVALPKGAARIKFEDPRLQQMMAAPIRRPTASRRNRSFIELIPKPGTLLLWESWLRHEVPPSRAKAERISVSFNYSLGASTG